MLLHQPADVQLDEWVSPDFVDDLGFLRSGPVLEWLDVVGGLAAARYSRTLVVAVSMDYITLLKPVRVHSQVVLKASVVYTSYQSIGVSVSLHPYEAGTVTAAALTGYLIFVALDREGRTVPVDQFSPATPGDRQLYREGRILKEFREGLQDNCLTEGPSGAESTRSSRQIPSQSARMNWIESTAYRSARAYLGYEGIRLCGLHGCSFLRPVPYDENLQIYSRVVHVDAESLTVGVQVYSGDQNTSSWDEAFEAFFTFVPTGGQQPPSLADLTRQEQLHFEEVGTRLQLQRHFDSAVRSPSSGLSEQSLLLTESCSQW